MPDVIAEIQEVAKELGAKFTEFKSENDKRLEAVEGKTSEVGRLSEGVDKFNENISALDKLKSRLEELETKSNRSGSTGTDKDADEYKSLFVGDFMRKGNEDELKQKAISIGVPAEGGLAVPEELDRSILQLERDNSPMRGECSVIAVSNEEYKKLVSTGNSASGWVDETEARPETNTPTLVSIAPVFGEIYANPALTQKSLEDMFFDPAVWLAESVGIEFGEKENAAVTVGDGIKKPKGLLASTMSLDGDAVRPFSEIQYIPSGTHSELRATAAIAGDNLINLIDSMKPGYRMGAKFMMGNLTIAKVRKLKDADNNYLWRPGLQSGVPSSLLGYGIVENEAMPDTAEESNSLAFGNFKRCYTLVDVRGVMVLRDPFTHKPFVHFYSTKRIGGMLTDSNAVKVLRFGDGAQK